MTTASALLGLHAKTSIHAGTGQGTGVIDLPIQREGHTGWPCVFGSAVKGALRARAEQGEDSIRATVTTLFGPDVKDAADHAGALSVGDARILLLPVRSLTSHFKWVTCPAVLHRFKSDAMRMGIACGSWELPKLESEDQVLANDDGDLFLEEYRLRANKHSVNELIADISRLLHSDQHLEESLPKQLVIVHDNLFGHLCEQATPVNAHVAIDNQTKTVKSGALWYEETLPPETILYVSLGAVSARGGDTNQSAADVMQAFANIFEDNEFLQIGGNETVGMGWCHVKTLGAG